MFYCKTRKFSDVCMLWLFLVFSNQRKNICFNVFVASFHSESLVKPDCMSGELQYPSGKFLFKEKWSSSYFVLDQGILYQYLNRLVVQFIVLFVVWWFRFVRNYTKVESFFSSFESLN